MNTDSRAGGPENRRRLVITTALLSAFCLSCLAFEAAFGQEAASTSPRARLANISTRGFVSSGVDALIGGFIPRGPSWKKVVIRGLGPSLPLSGTMADPYLALYARPEGSWGYNDDWQDYPPHAAEVRNRGLAPAHPAESAIVVTLPGSEGYTSVLYAEAPDRGVGLVEIYDVEDDSAETVLVNLSTRGKVKTGEDVLIGGFIIKGSEPLRVLLRALGPSMSRDIPGTLADPAIELYDRDGQRLAANDNWRSDQAEEISATSIAPSDEREAAIVRTLAPDAYTAIVRGVNETTGLALVEVYALQ